MIDSFTMALFLALIIFTLLTVYHLHQYVVAGSKMDYALMLVSASLSAITVLVMIT